MEIKDIYKNVSNNIIVGDTEKSTMMLLEAKRYTIPTSVQETLTMLARQSNINIRHNVLFKLKDSNGKVVGFGKGMVCNTVNRIRSSFITQSIREFQDLAVRLGFNPSKSEKSKDLDIVESGICSYIYRDSEVSV